MSERSQKPLVWALVLSAVVAAGVILMLRRSATTSPVSSATAERAEPSAAPSSSRPRQPPGPDGKRPAVRAPRSPELTPQWRAELTQQVRGLERPGEAAFSAYADRFVDENLELAQEQARAEGLTLPEVRALTRLGLMVMATQRLDEVEDVLGKELSAETKRALGELVHQQNDEFKRHMRELVGKGAPEAERWQVIGAADQRFREAFLATAGMTAEQFDDLLAGNLLLPGSPPAAAGAPSEPGKRDTLAIPPRPSAAPPTAP